MINQYIQFGIYGLGFVFILNLLKIWIMKLDLTNIQIPTLIFGFVFGSIGKYFFEVVMLEVHPEFPILAILILCFFGAGLLGVIISMLIEKDFANSMESEEK